MITHLDMLARIATGAALGGIIGFERDIHGRHVGLRTHLIVAMASATFMVVSNHFVPFQHYDGHVEADVSRIAASVVSGIGFLAGGAILKTGATIQGLTTAAGLWLVTAIGLASGAGMYVEGVAVTAMGLLALTVFRTFEDKNDKLIRRYVTLTLKDEQGDVQKLMDVLTGLGIKVGDLDYEKRMADREVCLRFEMRIPVHVGVNQVVSVLEAHQATQQVHLRAHA